VLKDRDIICISSIDWDFIWQGHQQIMSTLARNGNRVLFIENTGVRPPNFRDLPRLKKRIHNWLHSVKGIRKESDDLFIYSPLILPFPYSRLARCINKHLIMSVLRRWIRSAGFKNPIIWTFLPTGIVLDIINSLDSSLVIYYCIDNFSASSNLAGKIKKSEEKVIATADMVFVTAKNLYDWCSRYNQNVHMFPFGVNLAVYEKAKREDLPVPADILSVKHPIVGYVGGVHKWIDFELIAFLAQKHKDKSFVFVGPIQTSVDSLKELPNIYFLGQKQYEALPGYVKNFDVCVIPYLITEYTKNVYPTKLTEYLALGKAVVSTAIPEVTAFNERHDGVVYVGSSKEEFSSMLDKAVSQRASDSIKNKRMGIASEEGDWNAKIEKMSKLIDAGLVEKESQKDKNWKDNLLKMYAGSRKRIIPLAATIAAVYLLFFHTSFIWFIGKPLKISDDIKHSDAILVLAGGVGESGKAGQGYTERLNYAIELYRKGYAPHIIISSGYKYVFKEAEMMKALAVSMAVPADAIILEENARNTYENIQFSKDILVRHHWKTAILISSPYNMRRASLIARKIAPNIDFVYAPIIQSGFYGDGKRVELRHVKAILHEYAAIIFYRIKGYL